MAGQSFPRRPRLPLTAFRLRFFCCTVLMTLLLLVSIVLSLALVSLWFWSPRTQSNVAQWARPPNIAFNGIQLPTNSSAVSPPVSNTSRSLPLAQGFRPSEFARHFSFDQHWVTLRSDPPVCDAHTSPGHPVLEIPITLAQFSSLSPRKLSTLH